MPTRPARFPEAVLVLIDMQDGDRDGALPLPDAEPAVAPASRLLAAARDAGALVFHAIHEGRRGGLFDPEGPGGAIVGALTPRQGEQVVPKSGPSASHRTSSRALPGPRRAPLVVAGFMTHLCVSTTTRAALDHDLPVTVAADACAARDLPDAEGGTVGHDLIHRASLAALGDRFAALATVEAIVRGPA
jgi:nicotinamidase-related amidase